MDIVFTLLSILLFVAAILYRSIHRWKNRRFYELLSKMDTLPSYPIIGNIHLVLGPRHDILPKLMKILKTHGTPVVFWSGNIAALVLSKLEDIQIVTSKCTHRETLDFVEETLLNGIVTQRYNQWRKTRRLLNPAFGYSMTRQYARVFNEQIQITCNILKGKADTGEEFDIWPYMVNASIDMTTETIMGVKPQTQLSAGSEYSEALIKIIEFTVERIFTPWLHPKIIFDLYMTITGQRKYIKVVHDFSRKAVILAKEKYEKQRNEQKNQVVPSTRKKSLSVVDKEPKTLAEILLASHYTDPTITEKQIQAEFIHIISAGSESTAITMAFLMLMFGIHQDVQEKAYQEVKLVTGNEREITIEDLNELTFVEQCIKETLRVFTVLPVTIRCTNEELKISGDRIIPANCIVVLVLEAVHENSEYYPNSKQWDPTNFSKEATEKRPKNSFVGFSLGSRACLGSKYAISSLKIQICYILRNFRIRTNRKYKDIGTIVDMLQRSKNGYPIILDTRPLN